MDEALVALITTWVVVVRGETCSIVGCDAYHEGWIVRVEANGTLIEFGAFHDERGWAISPPA